MIKKLVENSFKGIDEELYNINNLNFAHDAFSLKRKIIEYRTKQQIPIITEIKFSSPSRGVIRDRKNDDSIDLLYISKEMILGGAAGLSVLTQKYLFNGSID